MNYLYVFLGGGLGSILRFSISNWIPYREGFPLATLLSNVAACIIMAFSIYFLKDKTEIQAWSLFLITGFCGGFSTFSTFSYETVLLMQNNQYLYAGLNILISLITCFAILYLLSKFI